MSPVFKNRRLTFISRWVFGSSVASVGQISHSIYCRPFPVRRHKVHSPQRFIFRQNTFLRLLNILYTHHQNKLQRNQINTTCVSSDLLSARIESSLGPRSRAVVQVVVFILVKTNCQLQIPSILRQNGSGDLCI